MTLDQIESGFTLAQLMVINRIQEIGAKQHETDLRGGGRRRNSGRTPEEINKNAWRLL